MHIVCHSSLGQIEELSSGLGTITWAPSLQCRKQTYVSKVFYNLAAPPVRTNAQREGALQAKED